MYPQHDFYYWTATNFKNYNKFIKNLEKAIADERTAIDLYQKLYEIAPTEIAKYSIKTALKDEKEHNKELTHLYIQLTGREPDIKVEPIIFHHFYDGLQNAFLGQVKAFEFYKEMYLSTFYPPIRDLLYSIQHDEIEHATLFNWVHTELK